MQQLRSSGPAAASMKPLISPRQHTGRYAGCAPFIIPDASTVRHSILAASDFDAPSLLAAIWLAEPLHTLATSVACIALTCHHYALRVAGHVVVSESVPL